jgi:hypothetical protein
MTVRATTPAGTPLPELSKLSSNVKNPGRNLADTNHLQPYHVDAAREDLLQTVPELPAL